MSPIDEIHRTTVVAHATTTLAVGDARRALARRLRRLEPADDRGDVEARTVTIAVMVALALAVGVIITAKVKNKAEGISLQ